MLSGRRDKKLNSNKKTTRIVGVLFMVATATFIIGSGLIDSVLMNGMICYF